MQAYIESLIGQYGFIEPDSYTEVSHLDVYKVLDAKNIQNGEIELTIEGRTVISETDFGGNNKKVKKVLDKNFIYLT